MDIISGFTHVSHCPSESAQSRPCWTACCWCLGRSSEWAPFCTKGPTRSLCSFNWTEDNRYFYSMSFANNGAPNCQVLFHFEAVWYCLTGWHKPQAIPNCTSSKKKGLESTLLSMRLACSKRDTGQNWQPYFSCAVVLIKCLSYQSLTFFFFLWTRESLQMSQNLIVTLLLDNSLSFI